MDRILSSTTQDSDWLFSFALFLEARAEVAAEKCESGDEDEVEDEGEGEGEGEVGRR